MTQRDTDALVLEEVTRDLKEMAVEEGIVERAIEIANDPATVPPKPTSGKAKLVIQYSSPEDENVRAQVREAIDVRRANIAQEWKETVTDVTGVRTVTTKIDPTPKSNFTRLTEIRYDLAPEEEIVAAKERIDSNVDLFYDIAENLSERGVKPMVSAEDLVWGSDQQREISPDEWQPLLQFREWPDYDTDGSTKRMDYFRQCMELADKLLEGSPDFDHKVLAKPALEIYAILRNMGMAEESDSQLNNTFAFRMFHLGLKIYHAFAYHPEEFQDLTLWQYDALLDSVLQYTMDNAEKLNAGKDPEDLAASKHDTIHDVRASLAKLEKRERSTGSA